VAKLITRGIVRLAFLRTSHPTKRISAWVNTSEQVGKPQRNDLR
jgi:hypothetical protein